MRVAVMGSGSWGTAMAKVLCDTGADVVLWARRESLVESINTTHCNSDYLPDVELPKALRANSNAAEVLDGAELVVCAVPSQSLRANVETWVPHVSSDAIYVSLAKGIEISSLKRMSEVLTEVTGAGAERVAVLTGPNLAREIAAGKPAATVVACADHDVAQRIQKYCSTSYFRPYTNTDVVGCEIGGAVKNVIALSCGMAAGAGLGENAIASLITRGLAETTRLGIALGAKAETLAGLAGVGDLVATCTSPLSRNRSFGIRLGEGRTLDEAQAATNGQVAEGVKSCTSVQALARDVGVDMPLTDAVRAVCHDGLSVPDAVVALLGRTTKPE